MAVVSTRGLNQWLRGLSALEKPKRQVREVTVGSGRHSRPKEVRGEGGRDREVSP